MVNNNIYFCGTAEPFKKETWLECSIGATTKATSIVQIRNPNNDIPSEKICKKYRISQNFWAAENETFFFFPLSLPRLTVYMSKHMIGVLREAVNAYPSRPPEFTPGVLWFLLLISSSFCAVSLLCVFTLLVPCCDVRYIHSIPQ
jgi:hypothetical protein